ncbi:MAG TPA: DUF3341 domain-containing protein [Kofleriaceae bacterium]|jgi:hypothetical protein
MRAKILVASFAQVEDLLRAVRKARRELFRVYDVFAPFPIHGLDEAMGIRRTRLPYVTLIAGLTGLATALTLQFYTNVLDWPLNVGGKPDNSLLAFIPISFELTVLFAGLTTVGAFLLRARLYPGKAVWLVNPAITDDTFVVVLRKPSDDESHQRAVALLKESGAASVTESEANL